MRAKEIKEARKLRLKGYSVREIAQKISCAKSSVSEWVRGIPLTDEQIARLKSNQDRGRAKAANHPNSPKQVWAKIRSDIIRRASQDIPKRYSSESLKVVGTALYWAEGYNAAVNIVNFSNSNPKMIALMMRFFREVCGVPDNKFRGGVNIHPHLNREKALHFWSKVSGIPVRQFHKTQIAVSRASKGKRDTLPLGTFKIIVCDARLASRIKGWIQGIEKWPSFGACSKILAVNF